MGARPALVIGLGGTGQWILTYLKRELIESSMQDMDRDKTVRENGLPKGVRLLAFDTVQQRTQGGKEAGDGDTRHRKVGSVELEERKEYQWFGGNIKDAVDIIWTGEAQPNYRAYEPQKWLKESYPTFNNLPNTLMNATDGAGAVRQVGRMALINDIRNGQNSKILKSIEDAIQEISDELGANYIQAGNDQGANNNRRLEVIFATSLAGGGQAQVFSLTSLCGAERSSMRASREPLSSAPIL